MKQKLSVSILFLFLTGCSQTDPTLSVLWQDFQARRQLKAEKFEEALQSYYNVIEMNPYMAGTHSNIGVILNYVQRPEDALKSLEHALQVAKENKDVNSEFAVQFNLGVYYGATKKVEQALEHYQAALDIVPGSIEAKTNIELLVQQNQSGQDGENSDKDQQNQNGQSGNSQNKDNKDNKDQKNDSEDQKKDQKKDGDKDENKDDGKKRENSPKYKPRAFKGEELSEGDVKKILGELRNQEQKIRANFEKKEKGKTKRNEKDW